MSEIIKDPRIIAIRGNPRVGHGSCSVIDECYDDQELIEILDEKEIRNPIDAIRLALKINAAYWERGLDACSGEPETDRRLQEPYREARDALKEFEKENG